jgi:hypothetical protein
MYVHGFADEMGEDLDNIIKAFKFFNKYGTQRIYFLTYAADQEEQGCLQ